MVRTVCINLCIVLSSLVNGNSKVIDVKNMEVEDISEWMERLRNESGVKLERIRKFWNTDNPSIQGTWNPFLNKPIQRHDISLDTRPRQSEWEAKLEKK